MSYLCNSCAHLSASNNGNMLYHNSPNAGGRKTSAKVSEESHSLCVKERTHRQSSSGQTAGTEEKHAGHVTSRPFTHI